MTTMLKATARPGLQSGGFRTANITLLEHRWTDVDADDPKVRADLVAHVPNHIRIAQGQEDAIAAAGLAFKAGKILDLRAEKAAADKAAAEKVEAERAAAEAARAADVPPKDKPPASKK